MSKPVTSQPAEFRGPNVEELLNDAYRALVLQARFFHALGQDEANVRTLSSDECDALVAQTRVIAGMIKPVIDSLGHPEFNCCFEPANGGAR